MHAVTQRLPQLARLATLLVIGCPIRLAQSARLIASHAAVLVLGPQPALPVQPDIHFYRPAFAKLVLMVAKHVLFHRLVLQLPRNAAFVNPDIGKQDSTLARSAQLIVTFAPKQISAQLVQLVTV
jgi:hypothetical protein